LDVRPPTKVYSYNEPGGTVHYFGVRMAHPILEILAEAVVETRLENPFHGLNFLDPDWSVYDHNGTRQEYAEFLPESQYVTINDEVRRIAAIARQTDNGSVAEFLLALNCWVNEALAYDKDATHVHSTLDEVLLLKAGVCQDFAHLMIACCRSQGIPTRYVSGYLYVHGVDGMRGEQATHAWVDCMLPNGRWLSLDPTNNVLANDRYIRVHTGRDYSEVTPTRGVYIGAPAKSLDVSVSVDRVDIPSPVA